MIWESFFDDNLTHGQSFNLWKTNDPTLNLEKAETLFKGYLMKVDKNVKDLKERLFTLTDTHIYYTKNPTSNRIRGLMKTKFVKVWFFEEEEGSTKRFCVRFIKNMKFCDLYARNEEEWLEWREKLTRQMIQTDFHNRYKVSNMIGKGSFAKVYLVNDTVNTGKYAVKAFSKEFLESQSKGRLSLINEIDIMLSLDHPNCIKLYEVHETKNSIYLVLEYLQGGELFQRITESEELLTKEEIRIIMKDILRGLAYLEEKDILHRDLKPENLILGSTEPILQNRVKIVDFGLATPADVDEYLFKRCGTPGFVAPEIIKADANSKEKFTTKCDVFSAGVICYILLTGKNPFKGEDFKEILKSNRDCRIKFDGPDLRDKDSQVVEIIRLMMTKKESQRISASELLAHPFFANMEGSLQDLGDLEEIPDNLKSLQQKYKTQSTNQTDSMNMDNVMSMEFRFNGETGGAMNNSVNSINSLNSPNMQTQARTSISGDAGSSPKRNKQQDFYRKVLLSHAGGNKEIADSMVARAKRESITSTQSVESEENDSGSGTSSPKSNPRKNSQYSKKENDGSRPSGFRKG